MVKLLGFLLLGYILWKTDLPALGEALASVAWLPFLAAFFVSAVSLGFKAWRWNLLLAEHGAAYSLFRALMVYMSGIYIGLVTPGRLGELSRALYVKRDAGVGIGVALSSVIMDRLFDLYALMAVGLLACIRFEVLGSASPLFLVAIGGMLLAPLLLVSPRFGRWFTRRLLGRTAQKKFGKVLADGAEGFYDGLDQLITRKVLLWGVITVVGYGLFFWSGYLLTQSLGLEISFIDAMLVLGLANVLSLLPITVAGVGTRDGVFVFAFAALGLAQPAALAFSALVLANFYIGGGIVGLGCFLADRPPKPDAEVGEEDGSEKGNADR